MAFPTVSNRVFSADVGQASVGNAGPDAIEQDIDNRRNEIQGVINALQSTTDGDSGANNVKITPIPGITASDTQEALEALNASIQAVSQGGVADGSITEAKLASSVSDKLNRAYNNVDPTILNIIKLLLKNTGINAGVNAWSDTLEDTAGINKAVSSYVYENGVVRAGYTTNLMGAAGGAAIGDLQVGPWSNVYDGNTVTYVEIEGNAPSSIGYDFGAGISKRIRRFYLHQDTGDRAVTSVQPQYSDNGTNWYNAGSLVTVVAGLNIIDIPDSGAHRYWRLYTTVTAPLHWRIYEFYMYEYLATATVVWNAKTATGVPVKAVVEAVESLGSGSITYYVSRDNGVTYTVCPKGLVTDINSQPIGTQIVLKAVITDNAQLLAIGYGGEL